MRGGASIELEALDTFGRPAAREVKLPNEALTGHAHLSRRRSRTQAVRYKVHGKLQATAQTLHEHAT